MVVRDPPVFLLLCCASAFLFCLPLVLPVDTVLLLVVLLLVVPVAVMVTVPHLAVVVFLLVVVLLLVLPDLMVADLPLLDHWARVRPGPVQVCLP